MHLQTKEIASMLDLSMPSFKTPYEQDDLPNIVPPQRGPSPKGSFRIGYDHIVIPTP